MKDSAEGILGDKSRRRFFRYTCDASMNTSIEYDEGSLKSKAIGQSQLRVLNVSKGGVAIISKFPVVKETVVFLKISTVFNTTIRTRACARWSKRLKTQEEAYAIGFEFVKMSRGDSRNLKEFLKVLQESSAKESSSANIRD